jgi:hypothetical protein
VAVWAVAGLTGGAPPAAAAPQYGVHMDSTWDGYGWRRTKAIGQARDVLHAQVARNSFLWHLVEPVQGQRDWSRTDSVVDELRAGGIEPLMAVYGSPPWANGTPSSTADHYLYVPTDPAAFDAWVHNYADFMRAAARRYRGKVKRWELWNEENLHWNWKPAPSAAQYARWYSAVYAAIRSEDPDAEISLGALSGLTATGPGNALGLDFLADLLRLGVRPDNVAIHPYPGRSQAPDAHIRYETNFDDIALLQRTLVESGHPVPIWVTEWGWQTSKVDLATQAAYLRRSLEMIEDDYPYVAVATYFLNYDRGGYTHGLFDTAMNPKPAAGVFGAWTSGLAQRRQSASAPPPIAGSPPAGAVAPLPEPPATQAAPATAPSPAAAPSPGAAPAPASKRVRATARRHGTKLVVTARGVSCVACRATLTVRQAGRTRRVAMRRRGSTYSVKVRRVRRGRLSFSVLLDPGAATPWRTLK